MKNSVRENIDSNPAQTKRFGWLRTKALYSVSVNQWNWRQFDIPLDVFEIDELIFINYSRDPSESLSLHCRTQKSTSLVQHRNTQICNTSLSEWIFKFITTPICIIARAIVLNRFVSLLLKFVRFHNVVREITFCN